MIMNVLAVLLIWAIVSGLIALWSQTPKQLKFIKNYQFHPGIKDKLMNRYPDLTDEQIALVFQGLRDYFYICNKADGSMVSMPSRIVDEAWHEFILYTREYASFCLRAFNRFLHHTPSALMSSATEVQEGIKLAWRFSCEQMDMDSKKATSLPLLFELDALLEIQDGFEYCFDCRSNNDSFCVSDFSCGGGGCGAGCGSGGGCGGCGGCGS